MPVGSGLPQLDGYPFEVRYSDGFVERARASAELAAGAFAYFGGLFSAVAPSIALIVADEADWPKDGPPFGLPFFRDDQGELRPGIIVMSAGGGDFWNSIAGDLRSATPSGYRKLRAAYPDGAGGVDLQPFFDLITIHELGHAFEALGDLRLPTAWLSEIFVNLALHAFVATKRIESLDTLETFPAVGNGSRRWAAQWRTDGYSTLEELEAHYTGGEDPMNPLNYVWYQCRWQRLAAKMFNVDGEEGLVRFWNCFHARDRVDGGEATAASLAPLLRAEVSAILGRAVRDWC